MVLKVFLDMNEVFYMVGAGVCGLVPLGFAAYVWLTFKVVRRDD